MTGMTRPIPNRTISRLALVRLEPGAKPTRWAKSKSRPTAIGSADAAQPGVFLDRRRPDAEASLSRLWLCREGDCVGQRRGRAVAAVEGRGHRSHRRRGDHRQARRPFSALRLADRVRHAVEHERQRGVVEPWRSNCSAARSAARSRCTPTTTSIWGSRRTTPSRPHRWMWSRPGAYI